MCTYIYIYIERDAYMMHVCMFNMYQFASEHLIARLYISLFIINLQMTKT